MTGDELAKLLEPAVERLGYELSDLEVKLGGKNGVVRVFIDKREKFFPQARFAWTASASRRMNKCR